MTMEIRTRFNLSLCHAYGYITLGQRKPAMQQLAEAMRCANTVKNDPQYRKAVFKAMSFARRIG